jgi:predicted acetyltransferase
MMARRVAELDRLIDSLENRVVVYEEDGRLLGYLAFGFNKGKTFLSNALEVRELIYETRETLAGLLAFLHSQLDQVTEVIFNTQDDHFHHLLADPRNGVENILPHVYHESHVSGVGLMYRVIDTERFFTILGEQSFSDQNCRLKIALRDSFLPANDGAVVVDFADGRPQLRDTDDYEVEVRLDVAEFSSLVMGVIPFGRLYEYRLAEISDPRYIPTIDRLFATAAPPVCITRF